MTLSQFRQFKPPGPVAGAFLRDQASTVKTLLGPVGGGKTVSCIFDSIRRPSLMPACRDGIVRYRRAIVGLTYGQMERNLHPSWKAWLPEDGGDFTPIADWKGGGGRSAVHKLEWDVLRGDSLVRVKAEYIFAAVGDAAVEEFMRGFEPTDIWVYEMDQAAEAIVDVGITRLFRYPRTSADDTVGDALPPDVPFTAQIVGDLNAPDIDSWFFKRFEEDPPPSFRVYKQPSGLSPQAENSQNLRPDYYDRQIEALSKKPGGRHLVKRMVHAQYAPSLDGVPVYDEYDDAAHLSSTKLSVLRGVPIILGFDQGVQRPACVGVQLSPSGQWRVLFEVVPGRMNARRFAKAVREKIIEVAPDTPLADVHYCDPAGMTGADREDGDLAWAETVAAELGLAIQPVETNELDPRLTAVRDELTYMIGPGEPALIVSGPDCPMLRKGFASHYRYKREKVGNTERTSDKPEKNDWSNPHDALQYALLGKKGRYGAIEGRRDPRAPERELPRQKRRREDADDSCVALHAEVVI